MRRALGMRIRAEGVPQGLRIGFLGVPRGSLLGPRMCLKV